MSRRTTMPFSPIFGWKRQSVAIFWPKKLTKTQKNLNVLKIMVEEKEKRFWKLIFQMKR